MGRITLIKIKNLFAEPQIPAVAFWLLLFAAFAFSAGARYRQAYRWQQNQQTYFSGDIPMMTSHDAYYWLRWAREMREGTYHSQVPDPLRNHPDGNVTPRWPGVSVVVAAASWLSGANVYKAGFYVLPFLASLLTVPLALFFKSLGRPLTGVLTAAFAAIGVEYFLRTSVGRVDTDCLNLFFPILIALCLSRTDHSSFLRALFFAALSGFVAQIFHLWYEQGLFLVSTFFSFAAFLILNRIPPNRAFGLLAMFVLAVRPRYFASGIHSVIARLKPQEVSPNLPQIPYQEPLPDLMGQITELSRLSFTNTLELVFPNEILAATALFLFLVVLILHPRKAVLLLPGIILGIFAFSRGRRFAMYLAPAAGIGLAFGIVMAAQAASWLIGKAFAKKGAGTAFKPAWLTSALSLAAGVPLLIHSLDPIVPAPKLDARIYARLTDLRDKLPQNATVWNYWNWGYLMTDTLRRATYVDGSTPDSTKTFFLARSHSAKPEGLYRIAAFVDARGDLGIMAELKRTGRMSDVAARALAYQPEAGVDHIHVVYVRNMIKQFRAMAEVGLWDFKDGKPRVPTFTEVKCSDYRAPTITCRLRLFSGLRTVNIDVNQGTADGKPLLRRTVLIRDGQASKIVEHAGQGTLTLEIFLKGRNISEVFLLDETSYQSSFNQLFLLGRYDRNLFEKIYDAFPLVRAYRLKTLTNASPTPAPTRAAPPDA